MSRFSAWLKTTVPLTVEESAYYQRLLDGNGDEDGEPAAIALSRVLECALSDFKQRYSDEDHEVWGQPAVIECGCRYGDTEWYADASWADMQLRSVEAQEAIFDGRVDGSGASMEVLDEEAEAAGI
jgi:hypothetical protein